MEKKMHETLLTKEEHLVAQDLGDFTGYLQIQETYIMKNTLTMED